MSRFFTSEGKSIGVSPSASFHPMNYSGLVSFRIELFDLLAVQGTLESSTTPQFKSVFGAHLSL